VMVWQALTEDEHDAQHLLVLIWFLLVASMAFTQVRFNYYLAVAVAVMNAFLVGWFLDVVDISSIPGKLEDINGYQVLSVVIVLLIVLVPLLAPVAVGGSKGTTAMNVGSNAGPGPVTNWAPTLHWVQNNTPREGTYGGADNPMSYYGTYHETSDYNYPAGAYGVMAWWDYGHWITTQGERIPVANPFQQHATEAANFLIAPNETAANQVMAQTSQNDAKTRYVMVDWKMVEPTSKFGAPVVFYTTNPGLSLSDMYTPVFQRTKNGGYRRSLNVLSQRYYESMAVRLYRFHGSAMRPQPYVIDWDPLVVGGRQYRQTPTGKNASVIRRFNSVAAARAFVKKDGSSQVGGIGPFPSQYVPALKHYRLVKVSSAPAPRQLVLTGQFQNTPTWLKVFERVPGATIQGQGPPNATVTAGVRMRVPTTNSTFVYNQRAQTGPDGSFTMTLPYSTTGYDQWNPSNGHTNVSVRAVGPYTLSTPLQQSKNASLTNYYATVNVSEAKVVGEDTGPITVTLQKHVSKAPGAGNNSSSANNTTAPTNSSDVGAAFGSLDRPAPRQSVVDGASMVGGVGVQASLTGVAETLGVAAPAATVDPMARLVGPA